MLFFKKLAKERRRKILQMNCPHEYHIVNTTKADIGRYHSKWVERHDLYCPHCDSLEENVSAGVTKRVLKIQEIREEAGTIISLI